MGMMIVGTYDYGHIKKAKYEGDSRLIKNNFSCCYTIVLPAIFPRFYCDVRGPGIYIPPAMAMTCMHLRRSLAFPSCSQDICGPSRLVGSPPLQQQSS
jgi:hypothetical protein